MSQNATRSLAGILCLLLVIAAGCYGGSETPDQAVDMAVSGPEVSTPPSADEEVYKLEQMCAQAHDAIVARHTQQPLYDRVGGRQGLATVVTDTVQRHQVNQKIKHLMDGVDADNLMAQVTDFLVVATGGEGEYNGRDMKNAHAHLHLSNVEFLAAGSDLGASMTAAGWGENEIQELLCAFVSLRPEVVHH